MGMVRYNPLWNFIPLTAD